MDIVRMVIAAWCIASIVACSSGSPARPEQVSEAPERAPPPSASEPADAAPAARSSAPAPKSGRVVLDIAPRDHAPERPDAGWCAETAIQEALLHYGAFVPQRAINRAGKPTSPDLYWSDVPVALRRLGASFKRWRGGNYEKFVAWTEQHIRDGRPLVTGVKIYPTEHPEWGLDHMVLIVGFDKDEALYINTTWGYRQRMTHAALGETRKGISLKNRYDQQYAYAIVGLSRHRRGAAPVRLSVPDETGEQLDAKVEVEGLRVGARYQLARYKLGRKTPTDTIEFQAVTPRHTFDVALDPSESIVYRCHAVDAG